MASRQGEIVVLAGVNGAGKSSVAGAALESRGGTYYNPDKATGAYLREEMTLEEANSRVWDHGREQLERAIREGLSYAFETTLGGATMTRLLLRAATGGHAIRIWYVGLASPNLVVYDNSETVDLFAGEIPRPTRVLHIKNGRIRYVGPIDEAPDWAKPILEAAMKTYPAA